jgi:transcriptional regulator with PAS, ATPase and Fis domain
MHHGVASFEGATRRAVLASASFNPGEIVCASAAMRELVHVARASAASDAKVLITGESGVGKDLLARSIHASSSRARGPFIAVNCAGVTETLLESELFGHVRGSFTGAYRDKAGQLQLAHGGTLFLDEVGEMSLRMQALLLRFLENGEIQPVGADQPRTTVNVRVIAATNRDVDARVATGEFRADLLYRLRVIHLSVPPLRERPEDIPLLIESFIARSGRRVSVSPTAMRMLANHRWSGNVRELQNVIEQTLALSSVDVIEPEHLPRSVRTHGIKFVLQGERRRQVADELYDALVKDGYSFFEHIHPLFLSRDITRHDVRELVRRGLVTTCGNYRALLPLFGIREKDYKKFLNFLGSHDCTVDFRLFRSGEIETTGAPGIPRPALAGLLASGRARMEAQ